MRALKFWKAVVRDRSNFLERVIGVLNQHGIRYCVVGGVGVNAYSEPIVAQDLDIVVAADDLPRVRPLLEQEFRVREFEDSLNVYDPDSGLRVQVQLDAGHDDVVLRSRRGEVMGLGLPTAMPADLLRMKSAAAVDPTRRRSTRAKDVLDLGRLVQAFPELWDAVPEDHRGRVADVLDE